MKPRIITIITAMALAVGITDPLHATQDYTRYVDPMIGVDGGGNVFPGASVPCGMVKVGPDCANRDLCPGYGSQGPIWGFSHTHVSGTGGAAKYGNILVMPTTGEIDAVSYSSPRANEHAEVGLFSVDLTRYGISTRMSSTHSAAIHEYVFPETDKANVLLDMGSFLAVLWKQEFIGSEIRILSATEVEGYTRIRSGWNLGGPYTVYFRACFDRPAESYGTWKEGHLQPGIKEQSDTNEKTGAWFTFDTRANRTVKLKVAISFKGIVKAGSNLAEIPCWSVDEVRTQAVAAWNDILSQVDVQTSDEEARKIFYSSLYRIFLQPTDRTDENPMWAGGRPYYDDYYTLWDTFRATHPFITLLRPSLQARMVNSMIDICRYDKYMPDGRSGNDNGNTQAGSNAEMLIADAMAKGVEGIDYEAALQAMLKDAEVPPGDTEMKHGRGGLVDYNRLGYVSTSYERGGSRTMEYANNDYAISYVAGRLGKKELEAKYRQKACGWEKLWNDDIESLGFRGFIWPRDANGKWLDKDQYTVFTGGSFHDFFYETFSWELSFYVPHDMCRLIKRMGGPETFEKRLDTYFNYEFKGQKEEMGPHTTMSGMFQVSNEPGFLNPSLYCYINRPTKTAEIVRRVLAQHYSTRRDGLPGNDDSGSMAAWYAFHALGFFPNAGQDVYLISSPIFPKTTITLENGKKLVIKAINASPQNIYVQSLTINGQTWNRCWLRHSDIAQGGTMEFVMGPNPSAWATTGQLPPSLSDIQ